MPTLYEHVLMDHVDDVRKLVNRQNINLKTGDWTLLHTAAFSNLPRMTECLCELGADVHAKGSDDETPLHVASNRNRLEVANVLLAYGADPLAKDCHGKTPFDWAKIKKDEAMIALFQRPPTHEILQSKDVQVPAGIQILMVRFIVGFCMFSLGVLGGAGQTILYFSLGRIPVPLPLIVLWISTTVVGGYLCWITPVRKIRMAYKANPRGR